MDENLRRITRVQRADRDMHMLRGILAGIAIDGAINQAEADALRGWCSKHRESMRECNFQDLIATIESSLEDGVLDLEERADIDALIDRIELPDAYYDVATTDMQELHGIMAGIASDGALNDDEARGLSTWLERVQHLQGAWPYDSIDGVITRALADGVIDDQERTAILECCREFADGVTSSVCAVDPVIKFKKRRFCVTGVSKRTSRDIMFDKIGELGGLAHGGIVANLDYLVVCGKPSRGWAYTVYGRKIEQVQRTRFEMMRAGELCRIVIVQEEDFWDAVEEAGGTRPRSTPPA